MTLGRKSASQKRLDLVKSSLSVDRLSASRPAGVNLEGLLGLDVLRRTTVTLDCEQGEPVFWQPRQLPNSTSSYAGRQPPTPTS